MLSARLRARLLLSRVLGAMPQSLLENLRRMMTGAGFAGLLSRCWRPLLRHTPLHTVEYFELLDSPGVRIAGADSLLVRRLYWYGATGYEGAELQWWRHFCAGATQIVELGANIGLYSLHAGLISPDARVLAIEAHPTSAAAARRNLALNRVENVEVVQAAVVAEVKSATTTLLLPDADAYASPMGAYVTGAEIADRPAARSISVPTVAAHEVVRGAEVIKLDIEGSEADVLTAVEDEITSSRPIIFVEVLRDADRLRALLADWQHRLGYAAFVIGLDGLYLLQNSSLRGNHPIPRYGTRDLILIPQEAVASI